MVYKALFYLSNCFSYRLLKNHTHIHCIYFPPDTKETIERVFFLKQTVYKHELHIHSFRIQFPLPVKRCQLLISTCSDFSCDGLVMLSPLTLTSFKTKKNVTLKYAWFLKIGILTLDQERTNFIVYKFEYEQF